MSTDTPIYGNLPPELFDLQYWSEILEKLATIDDHIDWLYPLAISSWAAWRNQRINNRTHLSLKTRENMKAQVNAIAMLLVGAWCLKASSSEVGEAASLALMGIGAASTIEEVRNAFQEKWGYLVYTPGTAAVLDVVEEVLPVDIPGV